MLAEVTTGKLRKRTKKNNIKGFLIEKLPTPRRPIRRIRSKALISYRRFKSKIVTKFRNLISYQLMCVAKKGQKSYQEQNIMMTQRQ